MLGHGLLGDRGRRRCRPRRAASRARRSRGHSRGYRGPRPSGHGRGARGPCATRCSPPRRSPAPSFARSTVGSAGCTLAPWTTVLLCRPPPVVGRQSGYGSRGWNGQGPSGPFRIRRVSRRDAVGERRADLGVRRGDQEKLQGVGPSSPVRMRTRRSTGVTRSCRRHLAGPARLGDQVHDLLGVPGVEHDLDLDLREEVDRNPPPGMSRSCRLGGRSPSPRSR